jgi:hypothetical protein
VTLAIPDPYITYYGKKVVEEQVRAPQHDRKGVNFFITFVDGHVKDVLAERFAAIEEIRQESSDVSACCCCGSPSCILQSIILAFPILEATRRLAYSGDVR